MRPLPIVSFFALVALAGCSNVSGNVKTADNVKPIPAPPVKQPFYDPYAAYGSADATWQPPVIDRDGNIQKPYSPSVQAGRPNYENAPWATGSKGSTFDGPPGTF